MRRVTSNPRPLQQAERMHTQAPPCAGWAVPDGPDPSTPRAWPMSSPAIGASWAVPHTERARMGEVGRPAACGASFQQKFRRRLAAPQVPGRLRGQARARSHAVRSCRPVGRRCWRPRVGPPAGPRQSAPSHRPATKACRSASPQASSRAARVVWRPLEHGRLWQARGWAVFFVAGPVSGSCGCRRLLQQ